MKPKHGWGWPVAFYLFLGGLGGGMVIVSTVADIFFGQGDLFAFSNFVVGVLLGIGSFLLIFELGRPLQFWRVFSSQRAVMTVGAWLLGILILISIVYGTFWIDVFPWSRVKTLRNLFAFANLIVGVAVVTYTGILLGSMRARHFWNSPALAILFFNSGLSTGFAAQSLLAGWWPWQGAAGELDATQKILHIGDSILIGFELLIVFTYVLMMLGAASDVAKASAQSLLTGDKKLAFWGGLVGLGLLLPLILYILEVETFLASVCVLIGGLILRFLIVYSNERQSLPGEERYKKNLPRGDEAFLKAWN
jgi:formate-dependent nitrite reductase membrane component NrfD